MYLLEKGIGTLASFCIISRHSTLCSLGRSVGRSLSVSTCNAYEPNNQMHNLSKDDNALAQKAPSPPPLPMPSSHALRCISCGGKKIGILMDIPVPCASQNTHPFAFIVVVVVVKARTSNLFSAVLKFAPSGRE